MTKNPPRFSLVTFDPNYGSYQRVPCIVVAGPPRGPVLVLGTEVVNPDQGQGQGLVESLERTALGVTGVTQGCFSKQCFI